MDQIYRYRATRKGTLSSPFRLIQEGQIFESKVPMKGSWFQDADTPETPKSKVFIPYMKIDGKVQMPVFDKVKTTTEIEGKVMPKIVDPQYQRAMEDVKKMENIQDGKKPSGKKVEAKEGTGNQEVI